MKTSTKNAIITELIALVCSIISAIGTKSYITSNQEQTQKQTQDQTQNQEQMQNQSITVNIDGKEVHYQSEDVEALNNKIIELKIENSELKTDNQILNEKIDEMESTPDMVLKDYKLIIDGIEKNINSKDSIIEYSKNIYVRDDIVSILNENISIDEENNRIIIGDILGDTYLLMKTCPPYQTSDNQYYRQPDTFKMAGEIYTNGFSMQDHSFALFNLNGKYTLLNFTLGHIDDTTMIDGVFNIYLDEDLYQRIEISCEDLPQPFSIPLNNANKMKIVKIDEATPTYQAGEWYGFADMRVCETKSVNIDPL